jgi:hypothetical protein
MAMRNPITSWGKALLAGFLGTTAMTGTLWAERRARRHLQGPVDYDASSHVVQAASTLLHIDPDTDRQRRALFLLVHWGYGSAVGVGYRGVRAVVGNDVLAGTIFYAGCQSMAFVLFPTLGGTPPPWRWRRDMLISSLGQHAVYVAAVSVTTRMQRPPSTSPRRAG